MNERDKQIIADLNRFRFLRGDDIADLYFSHTKHPVTQANFVLKRLRRDGYIKCSTERRKYVYYCAERRVKQDSQKIGHFLSMVDFYKDLRKIDPPRRFLVEPKLGGKGLPEPDIFMIWRGSPWFVEIQRTRYTDKVMQDKLNRYEHYYVSGAWEKESWQPQSRKIFPYLWIIGVGKYKIDGRPFPVFQGDLQQMIETMKKQ